MGRSLATCAALKASWALYTPPGPRWRTNSRDTTEGLRPIKRAIRTWDKPASNPTIIAARSSTLSIRRQLTTSPPAAPLPHKMLTPYDTADVPQSLSPDARTHFAAHRPVKAAESDHGKAR